MKKFDQKTQNYIIELYCNKFYSAKKIGAIINVNEKTVLRFLKEKQLTRPKGKNYKYKCNDMFFSNIDTEQKAYWLGVIYADGNVSLNSSGTGQLFISSIDKEWLEKFLIAIESTSILLKEVHKKYKKVI